MSTIATRLIVNASTGQSYTETYEIPDPTPEELIAIQQAAVLELSNVIQEHMDTVARGRRYDSIASLVSYAGDSDPIFNAEGTAGKAWRSACWLKGKEVEAAVLNGDRQIPTKSELIAELPVFNWGE